MTRSTARTRDNRTAVDKAMALLNAFGEEATTGVGVSELARRAGLSKSTAYRLLASLQENKAVDRAGSAYRLGPMIQELGMTYESDLHARLRDALTPYLVSLYELTKQTVQLAVLDGTDVLYLNKLFGQLGVRSPSRIGGRAPAYCTAVGKALLAYNPENLSLVLERPREAWTEHTITGEAELRAELASIQRTNLSFDRQEIQLGLSCVAAPVFNQHGQAVAALSVSGQTGKFVPEKQTTAIRRVAYEASRAAAAVSAAMARARDE